MSGVVSYTRISVFICRISIDAKCLSTNVILELVRVASPTGKVHKLSLLKRFIDLLNGWNKCQKVCFLVPDLR